MKKRPIAVTDLYRIVTLEDPCISPDGKWIAFTRVQPDQFENGYVRNIWLVAVDGGKLRQLTRGGKDSSPTWSPDGNKIAFTSARDGKNQVYVLDVHGGEARQITKMLNGASQASWSPDSRKIAFVSAASADERVREDSNQDEKNIAAVDKLELRYRSERREQDDQQRLDPYPVWRIPYRVGTTFTGERYAQLYLVDTADDDLQPRRLTHTEADHEQPIWSPDGAYIYTARQLDPTQDEPSRNSGIFKIRASDGAIQALTDTSATCFTPRVSPDGKWVAFTNYIIKDDVPVTERITYVSVIPSDGGEIRNLNVELDRSAHFIAWTPAEAVNGMELLFSSSSHGNGPIYAATVDGALRTVAEGRFRATHIGVSQWGVASAISTPTTPQEIVYWAFDGDGTPQQLTHFNKAFLDEVIVQETHEFWYESPDGGAIQGWYLLPVNYQDGKQYPLALNIHGGPHVMWSTSEPSMFLEWQFHAARGYVVLGTNPRGSDGYGEAHMRALHNAWGEVAMRDILAGVDVVLQKGFVDEKRLAITGGSYGGYMVAWILGHSHRFKAGVAQRGVYNLLSFYGTSDVPSLISGEFGGEPWENAAHYWTHSPLAYAHLIKTPLLIEHAEQDYRVPIEQGEQLFAYVHRSGGTVKMLRYPREGHEKSRSGEPAHRVDRLIHMIEWFDTHCKNS